MGVVPKKQPQVKEPLQPEDFFSQFQSVPDTFGNVTTKETVRQLPSFNPKEYSYLSNPTPYDDIDTLEGLNASRQPYMKKAENALQQFGANFASGFGQGLANLLDVNSWGNDNYQSHLFGLSTQDMQDWAQGIASKNKILRENPGKFEPGDFGWWMEQTASAGTGLGMGAFALVETAAIETATGGLGTGAAITRLGSLIKNIKNLKGTTAALEAVNAVKDLRSAATVFGIMNRTNESRMEAMSSYTDIYETMKEEKNPDGSQKYTKEQLEKYASEGADKTFMGNMALLPLDILAFRTMVYNPISGAGTGLVEKLLDNIGNKFIRKASQYTLGMGLEGAEEGFQFVASEEGKHYAKVLGGQDDGTSFITRLGHDVKQDEFWNNFAGGVIGSPIIGGAMNLTNKIITGNRAAKLNSIHSDFVHNVGKMDNAIATKIRKYEAEGDVERANIARRQFGASKALSALHLDAMTDNDTAYNSYITFLEGTLAEVNGGKLDALNDLGFNNPTQEQVEHIKANFQNYLNDAAEMKGIYDNIKNKYNKNFVPEIAEDHFQLNRFLEFEKRIGQELIGQQSKLNQFGQLSPYGKEQYDAEYKLSGLKTEEVRLTEEYRKTENFHEKNNLNQLLDANKAKVKAIKDRLDEISEEEDYTAQQRSLDTDIINSALRDSEYVSLSYQKERVENEIALKRKNIALWNNKEYMSNKNTESIAKAKSKHQVDNTKEELKNKNSLDSQTEQAIKDKEAEIIANTVVKTKEPTELTEDFLGNDNLFAEDSGIIDSIKSGVVPDNSQGDPEAAYGKVVAVLSPMEFDEEAVTPQAQDNIVNGVKALAARLGTDVSFTALMEHTIKVKGLQEADELFNIMKFGWEKAGFNEENYDAVYSKLFSDPFAMIAAGKAELTPKQVKAETQKEQDKVVEKDSSGDTLTEGKAKAIVHKGVITHENQPKFANNIRLNEAVIERDENGNIVSTERVNSSEEINQGQYVDNFQTLDPKNFKQGDTAYIRVPEDHSSILVPVHNKDGVKITAIPFSQYVAERGLTPDMQEYKDKIPMVIYKSATDTVGASFVHDVDWYNDPASFDTNFSSEKEEAIRATREIREAVLANGNKAEIVITAKRATTFAPFLQKTNSKLSEASPDSQLAIALTDNTLNASGKGTGKEGGQIFPRQGARLHNTKPFTTTNNTVYEVRLHSIDEDGTKVYIASPVVTPKLDEEAVSTVMQTINIFANLLNTDPAIRSQHDPIIEFIKANTGINIKEQRGMIKFLKRFIDVFEADSNSSLSVHQQATVKYNFSRPYIAFTAESKTTGLGTIVFGQAGRQVFNGQDNFFINPAAKPEFIKRGIEALGKPITVFSEKPTKENPVPNSDKFSNMFGWYKPNFRLDSMSDNKPMVVISKDAKPTIAAPTYHDYLMSKYETNYKSVNIGTKDKPNYVSTAYMINYDLKSNTGKPAVTVKEAVPIMTEEQKAAETLQQDAKAKILAEAKKNLGTDFRDSNNILFEPIEFSEEQKGEVSEAITRIAGLTPDQQRQVVNFLYNEVVNLMGVDKATIPLADLKKQITATLQNSLGKVLQSDKEILAEIEKLFEGTTDEEATKTINSYKHRIEKINKVLDNIDTVVGFIDAKLAKVGRFSVRKVSVGEDWDSTEDEVLEGEDDTESSNTKNRDFWTDTVFENPENNVTSSIRKLLSGIPQKDSEGNPVYGVFGLPQYMDENFVVAALQNMLADSGTSFEDKIKKLEVFEKGGAMPWISDVIRVLKAATEQQKNMFTVATNLHRANFKFTMIQYNESTKSYTYKEWDTALSNTSSTFITEWKVNQILSSLINYNENGDYVLNNSQAQGLIDTFSNWFGASLPVVAVNLKPLFNQFISKVNTDKPVLMDLPQQFKAGVDEALKNSDKALFNLTGRTYQISKEGNQYKVEFFVASPSVGEAKSWLERLGITLSDKALQEMKAGKFYYRYSEYSWEDLFKNANGLFRILYNKLLTYNTVPNYNFTDNNTNLLNESVVKALGLLQSKYSDKLPPLSVRDNGKSVFLLNSPKYITDRVQDLKSEEMLDMLKAISYSSDSFLLEALRNPIFRELFTSNIVGLTAVKEMGSNVFGKTGIAEISNADHEAAKLGMFWDTAKQQITMSHNEIPLRLASMFAMTSSDKHMMTTLQTAVFDFSSSDFLEGEGISANVKKTLFEQLVKPEIKRMVSFWAKGGQTNVDGYDKGAARFNMLPELNNLEVTEGLKLVDAIKHRPDTFTANYIESDTELLEKIYAVVEKYVNTLTEEKLSVWQSLNINAKTIDARYLVKFGRFEDALKVKLAAMDAVTNYLIHNANFSMLISGDIALYSKNADSNTVQRLSEKFEGKELEEAINIANIKATYINMGKRLANLIAPGTTLANSEKGNYLQLFLQDRKSMSEPAYLKFTTKINDGSEITDSELQTIELYYKEVFESDTNKASAETTKKFNAIKDKYPVSSGYFSVDGSDAQEYTTWKEHLDILAMLGQTPDYAIGITQEEIAEAEKIFSEETPLSSLSDKNKQLIGKIMQPIKPVYTGQLFDTNQDLMRTVYIKSSSFPLIPQLTAGMEIDKLRVAMQKIQSSKGLNVRASYQTANKVGGLTQENQAKIWDNNGRINEENLKKAEKSLLILNRKDFRIQQETPFKSGKKGETKISLGTQLMKLLFGDDIMNLNGFTYNGEAKTGKELHEEYNKLFLNLINTGKEQLYSELGLDSEGVPKDAEKFIDKLQTLLKDEAVKRNYPLQDIDGLSFHNTLDDKGNLVNVEFNLPLWTSSNSNRYESMLNSIIANRLIKMKFPGNSFVVGSEEGFVKQEMEGEYSWARYQANSYEVSSGGDRRFSALYARLKDGRTIEEAYQLDIKGYRSQGNNWKLGKGKRPLRDITEQQQWEEYKQLWETYLNENPGLLEELSKLAKGKTLTDKFASTKVSQARALSEILNERFSTIKGVDTSKIIYTSAWNDKSLQASYYEDGSLKKAQVFISSKFKDANGELIDLFEGKGNDRKYIVKTETGWKLKEDMFDKELLSLITFRIPTSGHQSASQVEIAGFLPSQNADLMIVPRNFTKQKGLDFDVDKENSYMFWTHITANGKYEVLSERHRADILAQAAATLSDPKLEELKEAVVNATTKASKIYTLNKLNEYLSSNKLLDGIFPNIKINEEDLEASAFLSKINNELSKKITQNELIKINHSVLGSTNPEVQAKINKTLNTDYAEEQATLIDDIISGNKDETFFTGISDEYQKNKMLSGSSGKIGTGASSLDVVFHSLTQQLKHSGKPPIELIEFVEDEEGNPVPAQKVWEFGSITSNNTLGESYNLSNKGRSISETVIEAQQVMVDNEKLQIMSRVGINDKTLDVYKVFLLTGIDKGEDGNSIPYLFLSQPIIREYIEKLKNLDGILNEFDADKNKTAMDAVIEKYLAQLTEEQKTTVPSLNHRNYSANMSSSQLLANLSSPDPMVQIAILKRFIEMGEYGLQIRNIQTGINTDSKGLGKSFFDVINKMETLNNLSSNKLIRNATGLIGDYIPKGSVQKAPKGYYDIGEFFVKPDTLSGGFNIIGLTTAYEMWGKFLPYNTPVFNKVYEEIANIFYGNRELSGPKKTELKQSILKEIKRYLFASGNNKLVLAGTSVSQERERLYIDTNENTSLAKYLKTLMAKEDDPIVKEFIRTNPLLNKLTFDVNKNGLPSLIKFNNAAGESFDEQYLYESLNYLLKENHPLPKIGNKEYTLSTLAQDIISYAYLGNSIQEAVQFTKFIPISYLNTVGFSERMRAVNYFMNQPQSDILGNKVGGISTFAAQMVQHFPNKILKENRYKLEDLNKEVTWEEKTFKFKNGKKAPFVAVYTKAAKGMKKFVLYRFDGDKYCQVPVLGVFGMDEYSAGNDNATTVVNNKVKSTMSPTNTIVGNTPSVETQDGLYGVNTLDSYKIMSEIANSNSEYAKLAEWLLPYSAGIEISIQDKITLSNGTQTDLFYGAFTPEENKVTINSILLNNAKKLPDTFIHEIIHSLTYKAVNTFVKMDNSTGLANLIDSNAPSHIQDLVKLFNSLKLQMGDIERINNLKEMTGKKVLTKEEKQQLYGFTDIKEFITMIIVNKGFQQTVDKIEYKNTGKSVLDKFKEILSQILQQLGVEFKDGSNVKEAISLIFDVIDENNVRVTENPFQSMWDDVMNSEDGFLGDDPLFKFDAADIEHDLALGRQMILSHFKGELWKEAMKEALLSDVNAALLEAAAQLNSTEAGSQTARQFYGNEFSDLALKLYPNETFETRYQRDLAEGKINNFDC